MLRSGHMLGGEVSNLDLGLQRTPCCRYTTPDRSTIALCVADPRAELRPQCAHRRWNGYSRRRDGFTDQEAPQAHAQEEAQEAAEADSLATSSAGSLTGA